MRVRYRQAARASYNHFLARRIDDPAALIRLQERFDAAEELLGRFPQLGPVGHQPGTRELVLAGTPFVFVYRIKATAVVILDIRQSARRPE